MAKFVFKLQSVLTVKEKMEDQAKQEYAGAILMLQTEEEKLAVLQERREKYLEEGKRLRENVLDPLSLQENTTALQYIKEAILEQKECVKKAAEWVESTRVKLQEAIIQRKTYEKLKEKAFQQFKQEVAKEENKENDELVSYVYGRRIVEEK